MSTPVPNASIYDPLRNGSDEIRLIMIESSPKPSDEICCSIETVELSASPEYLALSYVWGDANVTEGINIYSQAKEVVSWLGEEENNSDLAMRFIRRWSDGIATAWKDCKEAFHSNGLNVLLPFIEAPFDTKSTLAVGYLLRRSYWNRIWIVQEFVLAKSGSLICGGELISRTDLVVVSCVWKNIAMMPRIHDQNIMSSAISLEVNLNDSSVPQLLSLIEDRMRVQIQGRCAMHNTLFLVRLGFGRLCTDPETDSVLIQASKRSDAISFAGIGFEAPGSIQSPTWVPTYIASTSRTFFGSGPQIVPSRAAAADSKAECTFQDSRLLHTRGIICSEILDIHNPPSYSSLGADDRQCVWKWLALAKSATDATYHPTGVPWRQAFFQTLVAWSRSLFDDKRDISIHIVYSCAEGFMIFMRFLAMQIAHPFLPNKGTWLPKPTTIPEVLHNARVFDALDISGLVNHPQISEEVMYWLVNSDISGEGLAQACLLETLCGEKAVSKASKWSLERYTYEAPFSFDSFFRIAMRITSGRSFFVTPEGYMARATVCSERRSDLCAIGMLCTNHHPKTGNKLYRHWRYLCAWDDGGGNDGRG
ncbi:hypothetical protein N431DRAFT_555727 [Stipitochalara longipes BDJ]|nr:hypothetical protein N431DRAFT_555727 [Stipitochalara longipes BDJ]